MGEYARYDILVRFGVDIGDDDRPSKANKPRRTPCPQCGRFLKSEEGLSQHVEAVHHPKPLLVLSESE